MNGRVKGEVSEVMTGLLSVHLWLIFGFLGFISGVSSVPLVVSRARSTVFPLPVPLRRRRGCEERRSGERSGMNVGKERTVKASPVHLTFLSPSFTVSGRPSSVPFATSLDSD